MRRTHRDQAGRLGRLGVWVLMCAIASCSDNTGSNPLVDDEPLPPQGPTLDEEGTWTRLAPMPIAVAEAAIVAYRGAIYVTGGGIDTASPPPTAIVQRYDPVEDEWSRLNDLPETLNRHAMAVYRDTLLILGGQRSPSGLAPTADILAYDPETDSWSEWGSLPVAVWDLYAFGVGDELVVLDGNAFVSPPGDSITIFSDRDTWRYAPPPGDGFGLNTSGGVIDGLVYALTSAVGAFQETLWAFDPETDTWTRATSEPVLDARVQGAVAGERFHTLGDGRPSPKHRAFEPDGGDTWLSLTPPNETLTGRLVVGLGGRLYTFGGYSLADPVPTSDGYVYDPAP